MHKLVLVGDVFRQIAYSSLQFAILVFHLVELFFDFLKLSLELLCSIILNERVRFCLLRDCLAVKVRYTS